MIIDVMVHALLVWSIGAVFEAFIVLIQHFRCTYKCTVISLCIIIASFGTVAVGMFYDGLLPFMVLPMSYISINLIEKYMKEWDYHNYLFYPSTGHIRLAILMCTLLLFVYAVFYFELYAPAALLYIGCIAKKRGKEWIIPDNLVTSTAEN